MYTCYALTVCIANSAAKATDLILIMVQLYNELSATGICNNTLQFKVCATKEKASGCVMDDEKQTKLKFQSELRTCVTTFS